jgi:SAM-dependent methyltransferase
MEKKQQSSFLNTFQKRVDEDNQVGFIEPFILKWLYEDQTDWHNWREFENSKQFSVFLHWVTYTEEREPHRLPEFLSDEISNEMMKKSIEFDRAFFSTVSGLEFSENALNNIAINNVMDYRWQHAYPVPKSLQTQRVLDFGPGYGRAFNLYSQLQSPLQYIAVDSIPFCYGLQTEYFKSNTQHYQDYIRNPNIDFDTQEENQVIHLPTWRLDLIPDNHLDLIICAEVLPELDEELILYLAHHFHRILKERGAIFIRDCGVRKQRNKIAIQRVLEHSGFIVEWAPQYTLFDEVRTLPRILRKLSPKMMRNLI